MDGLCFDVISNDVNYDQIYRLRFVRGLKSSYSAGSHCGCDVILCSEFSDQLISFEDEQLVPPNFNVSITRVGLDETHEGVMFTSKILAKSKVRVCCQLPTIPGRYCLSFSYNYKLSTEKIEKIIVLSLISDVFTINSLDVGSSSLTVSLPMLMNFRSVRFGDGESVKVKEEYGSSIGSHLYDSAIVAINHLQHSAALSLSEKDIVLELGAGCGLTGIWLTKKYGCRSILTDLPSQIPLLEENILLNNGDDLCEVMAFDWADGLNRLDPDLINRLQMVIAADVLYDLDAARLLLVLLKELLIKSNCQVLLAQKNRNGLGVEEAKSQLTTMMPALHFECSRIEANVFIWRITQC